MTRHDAVVVGAGPNGLASAITLARAGRSVLVLEAEDQPGGGARSFELTEPGFVHDMCAAIVPLAAWSPAFREMPLGDFGLRFVYSPLEVAHPFDDGCAVVLERSVDGTATMLGCDGAAYHRLMRGLVADKHVLSTAFGSMRWPHYPLSFIRLAPLALLPVTTLARLAFRREPARALLAGMAAHSELSLEQPITGGFGLVMSALAHAVGWPLAQGGTQRLADALIGYLKALRGELRTGLRVADLTELPAHEVALFNVTPRQLLAIAGSSFTDRYRRVLRGFRYGPGVFKLDWALDAPIPWSAPDCHRAATVHLGGTLDEVALSERTVWAGGHADRPFVLLAQQSLFDPTRAPPTKHTAWAYCHVPHGSTVDMTDVIEQQVERFAPGFRQRIIARAAQNTRAMEQHNANHVGGDINGGLQNLFQLLTRPSARLVPYSTSDPRIFLCSSSTPPGGGVHGMCGYLAARAALRRLR
ncbi:MAG TPA: NAD(P)/FAD-dependent oxidoreductase [Chloroflexota bacterium]|nr:NAD(P)/FAD-dependent oxidoreductase [Chloroflexota bacterium]